jgi:hypothetical protein
LNTAVFLREEAARSRRLALDATDRRLQADLLKYAQDLEERAGRIESLANPRRAADDTSE